MCVFSSLWWEINEIIRQKGISIIVLVPRSLPEAAKALLGLVRSIGEWKAGSVTWHRRTGFECGQLMIFGAENR